MYFTNSMRNKISNNQFVNKVGTTNKTTSVENDKFWLTLKQGESSQNEILIGYVENATNELDFGYDGKLLNNGSAAISTLIQNEEYVIQGRSFPFSDNDILPLGFKTNTKGMFTISLSKTEGAFSNEQAIYLKDKLTGSITNLKDLNYSFIANEGIDNTRFEIVYKKATPISSVSDNQILVYSQSNTILFNSSKNKIKNIEIFDIQGRLLFQKSDIDDTTFESASLIKTNAVILISITDENNIKTKTKMIF